MEQIGNNGNTALHQHALVRTNHRKGIYLTGWFCDMCKRFNSQSLRWHCGVCNWDLCDSCYTKDKWILLPNSHIHPLTVEPKVGAYPYQNGYYCDSCKNHNPSATRHNCAACQFDLCQNCFISETERQSQHIQLSLHPHVLNMVKSRAYTCSQCNTPDNAYSWNCATCNYYLCVSCVDASFKTKLQVIMLPSIHNHQLTLVPARSVGVYQRGYHCDKCLQQSPTPFRWNCKNCQFDVCELCYKNLTTPAVTQQPVPAVVQPTPLVNIPLTAETGDDKICVICMNAERNATFVHQGTGHTVCCMSCAVVVRDTNRGCPLCRQRVEFVIQNFFS